MTRERGGIVIPPHHTGTFRLVLEKGVLGICIVILLSLSAIVIAAVAFRKLGTSLAWYDEVASVLLAWLTYFGCALAALRGAHLDFANVLMKLPVVIRVAAYLLGKAIVAGFFGTLAWAGWAVLEIFADETLITVEWVPLALTQSVLPIGCVLFILAEILILPENLRKVRAGIDRESEEIREAIEAAEDAK